MEESVVTTFWLSYGGGVNSTVLAILLCEGKLPQYQPWEAIFSDTHDEKPKTYEYVEKIFVPYLSRFGKVLYQVRPKEGVLQRWERLRVTGSRILRACSSIAKIEPIEKYLEGQGGKICQLIGIDADQPHRARPPHPQDKFEKRYPLVDLDIDRAGCEEIIRNAGLPIPPKSGCWPCPFMRVDEVMDLAIFEPEKFTRISQLEKMATETHGPVPIYQLRWVGVDSEGGDIHEEVIVGREARTQWGNRPAEYWMERAKKREEVRRIQRTQIEMFDSDSEPQMPCGCYDG